MYLNVFTSKMNFLEELFIISLSGPLITFFSNIVCNSSAVLNLILFFLLLSLSSSDLFLFFTSLSFSVLFSFFSSFVIIENGFNSNAILASFSSGFINSLFFIPLGILSSFSSSSFSFSSFSFSSNSDMIVSLTIFFFFILISKLIPSFLSFSFFSSSSSKLNAIQ